MQPIDPNPRQSTWKLSKISPSLILMIAAVLAVYYRPETIWGGKQLYGGDFIFLHQRRIQFLQEALFGPQHFLPAWYPREALGTPFWGNIQNFPWVPTRLILLGFEPAAIFALGINLAAVLSAVFTFFYCRRLGMGEIASAAAGWTFACAGYFASRVYVGHFPMLEAYPALPLLLLLTDRCLADPSRRGRILLLGFSTACIALCGHPQLPIYSIGIAIAFALMRAPNRHGVKIVLAMVLGAGMASFALWPMWLLIGRSNRMLPLDAPDNDIAFPYRRLLAFLLPWREGWPGVFDPPHHPLEYPNEAYFSDAVCYVGWIPVLAAFALLIRAVALRKKPSFNFLFIAGVGLISLVTALPWLWNLMDHKHVVLRSPSRQLYMTTFALAVGLGVAIDLLLPRLRKLGKSGCVILGLILAIHATDLGWHDHYFVVSIPRFSAPSEDQLDRYRAALDDHRVGIDWSLRLNINRELDDAGFFDSITLAKPYRALLDLAGKPAGLNIEFINAVAFGKRALAACGVKEVISNGTLGGDGTAAFGVMTTYQIENPSPRAEFFPRESILALDTKTIHEKLRDPEFDVQKWVMFPMEYLAHPATEYPMDRSRNLDSPLPPSTIPAEVTYERDSSDEMMIHLENSKSGCVQILESWDPGWHAEVNGLSTDIIPADDVFMAVIVGQDARTVHLWYETPGWKAGAWMSLGALVGLLITSGALKVLRFR